MVNDPDDAGPAGSPYDWWVRASALLADGSPAAAAQLLERLLQEEPWSRSVREGLARALYDAGRFDDAAAAFGDLVQQAPDDDYALFGLGLSLWRLQRFEEAVDPLAMAAVMRPDRPEFERALTQVRATLRARDRAGLPASGALPTGVPLSLLSTPLPEFEVPAETFGQAGWGSGGESGGDPGGDPDGDPSGAGRPVPE